MLSRSSSFFLCACAVSLSCLSCAPEGPDPDISAVKRRAAFETGCPKSKLHAYWLDDDYNTMGISGCGQKLVFVRVNRQCASDCQWILNSESKPREEE